MPTPFLTEANKAARARSAFSRLIAEMRASGKTSFEEQADDLEEAVTETADSALAKLFDFFAAQSE